MKEFLSVYASLAKMMFWSLVGSVVLVLCGAFALTGLLLGTVVFVFVSPWAVAHLWKHRNDVPVPDVLTPSEQADVDRNRLIASQREQLWTGKVN